MEPNKEILKNPNPLVEVIYAGGTISSLATAEGYREGGHVMDLVGQLGQHYPGFQDSVTIGNTAVAYTGLSENLDEEALQDIEEKVDEALSRDPDVIAMTHGTDSLEQTARRMDKKYDTELKARNKKLIITAANDDVSVPGTDVWPNLAFTFDCAADTHIPPGAYVSFHGKLIPASLVVKEPFNGREMNYTSKTDPEYLEAVRQQQARAQELITHIDDYYKTQPNDESVIDYPVNVIRPNHDELLQHLETNPAKAVLFTLYHSGTANTANPAMSVAELASKLHERGVTCFAVTENGEPVNFGAYETGIKLREAGIVPLGDMLHDVALAKLRLTAQSSEPEQLKSEMLANRVGEISLTTSS
jgi:L-asparaginase/Glu-tRNA(Gln) amidotransferase subunit D